FDYVLGFTDRAVIRDVLQDCARHRPLGVHRAAPRQPAALPGVRERWKFIEPTLRKAPFFKIVPMLGSLGCPYTCSFCIDSVVPYQPLDMQVLQEDLRFLRQKLRRLRSPGLRCCRRSRPRRRSTSSPSAPTAYCPSRSISGPTTTQ